MTNPSCPKCHYEYTYEVEATWHCPDCLHQWGDNNLIPESSRQVLDAHGNQLYDGDDVSIIKDLKVRGSSTSIKVGTKAKNIKVLEEEEDGHNIRCKIPNFGVLNLKSEFVKKS